MKEYIKNNSTPLLIGFIIGLLFITGINLIENIIIKIALIYSK